MVKIGNQLRAHPAYTEAMREAGWWTGIALAQVVNLLNPQVVLLADQHGADEPIQDIKMPVPVRDEQFRRSAIGALRRNSLDPAYRHLTGQNGSREIYGVQFGVHSTEPHEIDVSEERASILPMIGAAADMVDTFSEDFFNRRLTAAHAATPRS
jgi:predicted NBD/HSP70 family sugar kinase